MGFTLDERLEKSGHFVLDLSLCRILLKNNAKIPWVVLVPRRAGVREYFELSAEDQALLIKEMSAVAGAVQGLYKADKINTAAYGNMVPQLHVHIFARFETDHAWPKPVWAVQADEIPYTEGGARAEVEKLRAALQSYSGE